MPLPRKCPTSDPDRGECLHGTGERRELLGGVPGDERGAGRPHAPQGDGVLARLGRAGRIRFSPSLLLDGISRLRRPRRLQTVTIARLMELAPADPTVPLVDPTPFVYDSTMLMGASCGAGL